MRERASICAGSLQAPSEPAPVDLQLAHAGAERVGIDPQQAAAPNGPSTRPACGAERGLDVPATMTSQRLDTPNAGPDVVNGDWSRPGASVPSAAVT